MKIHFSHYKLLSSPKPYGIEKVSTDTVKGYRINTPKHLFLIGIYKKPKPQVEEYTLTFSMENDEIVIKVD